MSVEQLLKRPPSPIIQVTRASASEKGGRSLSGSSGGMVGRTNLSSFGVKLAGHSARAGEDANIKSEKMAANKRMSDKLR